MLATLLALTVRLYAPAGADAAALAAAERQATDILRQAGISLEWIDCRGGQTAASPCSTPLGGTDIVVRFVNAADSLYTDRPLGEALVDRDTGGGALATVYMNRLAALAKAAGMPAGLVYGRAIAHELGHLLLGSNEHRARGLMSAGWSLPAMKRRFADEWRFDPGDAEMLRQRLASRTTDRQASPFELTTFVSAARDWRPACSGMEQEVNSCR